MENKQDILEELNVCMEDHGKVIVSLYLGKDLAEIRDTFHKFNESEDGVDRLNLYDTGVARVGDLVVKVDKARKNLWKQHNFPYRNDVLVESYRLYDDLEKVRKSLAENWEAVEKESGFSLGKRAK